MRTLMSHERSELTYPSETVPPIQAGFATAMNRPLCSFVSAMRFGAPQRQDIENPSCRSVRFDLRGLFLFMDCVNHNNTKLYCNNAKPYYHINDKRAARINSTSQMYTDLSSLYLYLHTVI